jgi:hypothetical protein
MLGTIVVFIKAIFVFLSLLLLVATLVLTSNDGAKEQLVKLLAKVLTGRVDGFIANKFVMFIVSVLSTIAVPILSLTTFLTIPFHGIKWLSDAQRVVDDRFWIILLVLELIILYIYHYSLFYKQIQVLDSHNNYKTILETLGYVLICAIILLICSIIGSMVMYKYVGDKYAAILDEAPSYVPYIIVGCMLLYISIIGAVCAFFAKNIAIVWYGIMTLGGILTYSMFVLNFGFGVVLLSYTGNDSVQYAAGFCYEHGRGGLPKDIVAAARFYELAAVQGNANAKSELVRLKMPNDDSRQK